MSKQLREKLPAKHNAEFNLVCAMNSLILLTASVDSLHDFTNRESYTQAFQKTDI